MWPRHFLLLSLLGLFNDRHVRCDVENYYRAITLVPVVAEVFGSIVAVGLVSEQELQTDDLQFGL